MRQNASENDTDPHRCAVRPLGLGPVKINETYMDLEELNKQFPEVSRGGQYTPSNCTPNHRVAIIVPYRNRLRHLVVFLNHMHAFMIKQQLEYGIYAIEQEGIGPFNRGKLMNVGFQESVRLSSNNWQCFVFHDIDLLPLDSRNMYSCPRQTGPRHMSVLIDKFRFRLPYNSILGGVLALTFEQIVSVNGFSNGFWGWGGEDDDMYTRVKKMHYRVVRYEKSIGRYMMLNHSSSSPNPQRYRLLKRENLYKQEHNDGLSSLDYKVILVKEMHLFTYILVNIDEEPETTTAPIHTKATQKKARRKKKNKSMYLWNYYESV